MENSDEGLIQGLSALIRDRNKLQIYKNKARSRRDFFSVGKCIKQWEDIFDEV